MAEWRNRVVGKEKLLDLPNYRHIFVQPLANPADLAVPGIFSDLPLLVVEFGLASGYTPTKALILSVLRPQPTRRTSWKLGGQWRNATVRGPPSLF